MQRAAQNLFAIGLAGLGLITLIYGDFALVWQPVPAWLPAHRIVADGSGIVLLLCGIGLLFRTSAAWVCGLSLAYCFLWLMLKVPGLFAAPLVEGSWLGVAEPAVIQAGACALFARLAPGRIGFLRPDGDFPRLLFGAAIVPIGLAHIIYLRETAGFIPHWFPLPLVFAFLTGVAQLVCAVGLMLSIFSGWTAMLQAAMFSAFTFIVWVPAILAAPAARMPWTAFLVSWIITAAAWIIAADLAARPTPLQKNG
jgi:uncharacterized membrane protein